MEKNLPNVSENSVFKVVNFKNRNGEGVVTTVKQDT